ncbi:hypothetical protein [Dubosiella newyorkensis]|uniref:hypothetical protein n=1 Tax=Dubosiella newyorkensis TaxID=1862672 RepID=UPI003F666CD1
MWRLIALEQVDDSKMGLGSAPSSSRSKPKDDSRRLKKSCSPQPKPLEEKARFFSAMGTAFYAAKWERRWPRSKKNVLAYDHGFVQFATWL